MSKLKTISQVIAEDAEDATVISKSDREIDISSLTEILKKPVEKKEHEAADEIPESIKQRNNMEDIAPFRTSFADDEDAENNEEQDSPPDPEEFKDASSLLVVLLTIIWPMLLHGFDKLLIKSGQSISYYNLDEQNQRHLQEKAAPVVAEWLNRPQSAKAQLVTAVVTIGAAQLGGAYLVKTMNEVEKQTEDAEQQEEHE